MTVIDALGTEAKVGDEVLFGQAGKGAQELLKGVITEIKAKTVSIIYSKTGCKYERFAEGEWVTYEYKLTVPRKSKCFVIISYAE